MSKEPAYLGDSVYIEHIDGLLKLTTNNGFGEDQVIWVEPEVLANLIQYTVDCGMVDVKELK